MPRKSVEDQTLARRSPRQERALMKVELILEAATRLIEKDGVEAMTTNAIARTAGISIGTLYQYFQDKEAVLNALAEREVAEMSAGVMQSLQGPAPAIPGERVRAVLSAVLDAYGGRRRAHRLVMLHRLNRGDPGTLNPMYRRLIALMTAGTGLAGQAPEALSPGEAFVLTHAVAGVLRSMVAAETPPPRAEVEEALTRLIVGFFTRPSA